jgi:hypothetical protein
MALLVTSTAFTDDTGPAYGLLLVATGLLGLTLNALLGLGTVLAPVFVAVFDGLGFWWGLPLLSLLLLVALLLASAPLPLRNGPPAVAGPEERRPTGIPPASTSRPTGINLSRPGPRAPRP